METIDLHGLNVQEAQAKLEKSILSAFEHGETVVRIIHGQGKHSEYHPVLRSFVRKWLSESELAQACIETVFRGEDGSPYTKINAGETVVSLKISKVFPPGNKDLLTWEEEEKQEARRNTKSLRAQNLRTKKRQIKQKFK